MHARRTLLVAALFATVALAAGLTAKNSAGAGRAFLGFELKETKEELKLDYDVKVQDNGGGRMSVTFTLADEGRIKPIFAVDLGVPSKDGSGYYDVNLSLKPFERDGKQVYIIHLTRELVERGELSLKTSTMDGKKVMDWRYHRVVFAPHVKAMDAKEREKQGEVLTPGPATPAKP
jgi:hypothetical protein